MTKTNNCRDPLEVIGRAKGYTKKELINNLQRHSHFNPNLLKEIEKLPEVILRNSGSFIAKKIIRMMREVFTEAYRAKQFTRTEINNRGVLFGVVSLKHRVMDLVLKYFHERWPSCVIVMYNEHTRKTHLMNEKGVMQVIKTSLQNIVDRISIKHPIMPYYNDIQFSGKKIFETLYKSQNITERENPNYFKKMIPKTCFKLPGMRDGIEKRYNSRNKNLNDFL